MIIEPRWANDILSLLCVSVCRTAVGVIAPVTAMILAICRRTEWAALWDALSGCYWWRGGHGYGVIRLVCVGPLSSTPVLSGLSIKGARWLGALHLTPHQWLVYFCHAAGFSSWELFGGSDCIWLAVF